MQLGAKRFKVRVTGLPEESAIGEGGASGAFTSGGNGGSGGKGLLLDELAPVCGLPGLDTCPKAELARSSRTNHELSVRQDIAHHRGEILVRFVPDR
jgi:hypothetical protein